MKCQTHIRLGFFRFYFFFTTILFTLLFFHSVSYANQNTFTLPQVVELALAHDSEVLDAQDNLDIALSNLQIAEKEKGFNPTVTLTGDLALIGEVKSGASIVISDSVALNNSSSKAASQVKQSDLKAQQAKNALEKVQENVKQKVIQRYFEILKAEKTREMAQRLLDQSQILLQDVETKFNQNMASSVDLLRAKQSVENSRINLAQAEKNVQFQKQQMNLLIGRDLQLPLLLEDQFSYKTFPFQLDSLTSSAVSSRSELKDLQWQREGEKLTLKDIQRDRQAKIHLIGSYVEENYNVHLDLSSPDWSLDWRITGQFTDDKESLVNNIQNNTDPFTPSSPGWGVGLEVTWVPFDGGISEEKKKQQEIKIAQLERKLNTLPDSLSLEVLDAYDRLLQTDQAVLSAQLEKQIADESYRIQKQQFDAGYITDRTLKESELSLHDATVKYDKALYEYILAKVQLYQAAGKPILLDDL